MPYLVDSNIFIRIAKKNDPERQTALDSLNNLRAGAEDLCYTTQILAEFWNVCTRPTTSRGGLGLSLQETERKTRLIEKFFRLLPESLATHQEWRRLVVSYSVSGVQVYDARLVAVMNVHSITHLLTFNGDDFKRFSGIAVVDPKRVTPPAVN
jgi:predicted nucleic acid-binding protein